jgi:hypothetical protein
MAILLLISLMLLIIFSDRRLDRREVAKPRLILHERRGRPAAPSSNVVAFPRTRSRAGHEIRRPGR